MRDLGFSIFSNTPYFCMWNFASETKSSDKVAHTKILYFRDIESQVAELEFLQWHSNVTAVCTHSTVPLGGRKSRTLELLAFDEQSTFDTSA